MTTLICMLALQLLLVNGGNQERTSSQDSISIRAAEPPADSIRVEMIRWHRTYKEEMAPVHRQWARVVETIHRGRITELPRVCPAFRDRLRRLDRRQLLRVPDPILRTWLGRGLVLLDSAADHCRSERFFALGFRLYKARRVFQSVDWRLARYR